MFRHHLYFFLIIGFFFLFLKPSISFAQFKIAAATPDAETEALQPNPAITLISPTVVVPGYTPMTVTGFGFGDTYIVGSNEICFGNYCVKPEFTYSYLSSWSDTQVNLTVPDFASQELSGTVKLKVYFPRYKQYFHIESKQSYSVKTRPIIKLYYPEMDSFSTYTFQGQDFGLNQGKVVINGTPAPIIAWSETAVTFQVPAEARSGPISIENIDGIPGRSIDVIIHVLTKFSDDEYSHLQWYYENIHLPEAWQISLGSPKVIVAVIDGGVDFSHEDLQNSRWQNELEVPNNKIDDDKNGYIDDVYGWDFVNNQAGPGFINDHGTAVASVIASAKDNRVGLAGVAPNVKIMSLNVAIDASQSSVDAVLHAIKYAVDNGAQIINLSFGGDYLEEIYQPILQYAYDNNVLIVAAAGNDDLNLDINKKSPICNDSANNLIIGVGATDRHNQKSIFSNYGSACLDLSAPGEELIVAKPTTDNDLYGKYAAGTSFATPLVVGVAALIKSIHPDWNIEEIKYVLRENITSIDLQNPNYGGRLGKGLVNAYGAVTASKPTVSYVFKPRAKLIIEDTNLTIEVKPPDTKPIDEPSEPPQKMTEAPINNSPTNNQPSQTDSAGQPKSPTSPDPAEDTFKPFPDTKNYKYRQAVDFIKKQNIVQGYPDGKYKPNKKVNRAEFAKIVISAFKIEPAGKNCFSDVADTWFSPYVCAAQSRGIILGYPDGTFKPEQTINLVEALKIIILSAGIQPETKPDDQWYDPFIRYAAGRGLNFTAPKGYGDIITRGEMAQIIYWILNQKIN